MVVREYQFNRTCASKMRELKAKDDALRARERSVVDREAVVAERERRIMGASTTARLLCSTPSLCSALVPVHVSRGLAVCCAYVLPCVSQ